MATFIENKAEISNQEQIDLAADILARVLIQQVSSKRNKQINKSIENEYGKSN
jgi:hypothetical protein